MLKSTSLTTNCINKIHPRKECSYFVHRSGTFSLHILKKDLLITISRHLCNGHPDVKASWTSKLTHRTMKELPNEPPFPLVS